jgi:hypothetical protein
VHLIRISAARLRGGSITNHVLSAGIVSEAMLSDSERRPKVYRSPVLCHFEFQLFYMFRLGV